MEDKTLEQKAETSPKNIILRAIYSPFVWVGKLAVRFDSYMSRAADSYLNADSRAPPVGNIIVKS